MKSYNSKQSAHNQVVALFQSHTPCGQCTKCLDKAVRRVFETNNPTPDACRHLWAVLSACVVKNGLHPTRTEFEALACRHFRKDTSSMVRELVWMLMSNLSIAKAA